MLPSIDDQVVDFYSELFECLFSAPFRSAIPLRLRRNAVVRQIQEAADAASQSLIRFFLNQQLGLSEVADTLKNLTELVNILSIDDMAEPNITPEALLNEALNRLSYLSSDARPAVDSQYRVALHLVFQTLILVSPVMIEWKKLNFSGSFELPRRVVHRLNQISEQMDAFRHSGQAAADDRYELSYRDYLLQRFHRVEVGTVKMTTSLAIDLRELFVMPSIQVQMLSTDSRAAKTTGQHGLMDLSAARKRLDNYYKHNAPDEPSGRQSKEVLNALEQVKRYPRNIIVGAPGAGKSTFLEWLQLQLASVAEELVLTGQQAIPLLLRVRQLDLHCLPHGAGLIEKATSSKDIAALMPSGWLDRQMSKGRILFMLDGLDETEPELRDRHLMPWLLDLCQRYPHCHYLLSSRPESYQADSLGDVAFVECDLLHFEESQIREYTRRWCTAVRLARNESENEARREGAIDGARIVNRFREHPYIWSLACNPLMLSAICIVDYFEGGHLPEDRAMLYRLCTEGLAHYWDQRRGIRSEFSFDEKLRACREVALAMQNDDRAEYEASKVKSILSAVLKNPDRADQLLHYIRYRTGLLSECRPDVLTFVHLTFQEYLAARAIYEGNRLHIDMERIVQEHQDERWQEVIALFCGLVPVPVAHELIKRLIDQPDTAALSRVLIDAYTAAGVELSEDQDLWQRVLERVAVAPGSLSPQLNRFPPDKVAPLANRLLGKTKNRRSISEAYLWLYEHPNRLDWAILTDRLRGWREMDPKEIGELVALAHLFGPGDILAEIASASAIYRIADEKYGNVGGVALVGMAMRPGAKTDSLGRFQALLVILRSLFDIDVMEEPLLLALEEFSGSKSSWTSSLPEDAEIRLEVVAAMRQLANQVARRSTYGLARSVSFSLNSLADSIEEGMVA